MAAFAQAGLLVPACAGCGPVQQLRYVRARQTAQLVNQYDTRDYVY